MGWGKWEKRPIGPTPGGDTPLGPSAKRKEDSDTGRAVSIITQGQFPTPASAHLSASKKGEKNISSHLAPASQLTKHAHILFTHSCIQNNLWNAFQEPGSIETWDETLATFPTHKAIKIQWETGLSQNQCLRGSPGPTPHRGAIQQHKALSGEPLTGFLWSLITTAQKDCNGGPRW